MNITRKKKKKKKRRSVKFLKNSHDLGTKERLTVLKIEEKSIRGRAFRLSTSGGDSSDNL